MKNSGWPVLIFMLFLLNTVFSQNTYNTNLWTGINLNGKFNSSTTIAVDFGYRSYDHFIRDTRTILGRIMLEKKLNKLHNLGIGYALFDHYSSGKEVENRLFGQYIFSNEGDKYMISMRFRNELRYFGTQKTLYDRIRLQLSVRKTNLHPFFQPGFSVEEMLTPMKSVLHEERYQLSIRSVLSPKWTSTVYFTLQRQSTASHNQYIGGLHLSYMIFDQTTNK